MLYPTELRGRMGRRGLLGWRGRVVMGKSVPASGAGAFYKGLAVTAKGWRGALPRIGGWPGGSGLRFGMVSPC